MCGVPRVMVPPTERSPICAIESVMGAPIIPKKRIPAAVFGPKSTFGPSSSMAPSPPRRSSTSTSAAAISSRASSQLILFQRPSPRAPTRRIGCVIREALCIMWLQPAPF